MTKGGNLLKIISISLLLRIIAIVGLGFFQNIEKGQISVTDIDYKVYSDSTKYPSPYDRHTYRYTPILSYLMAFNYPVYQCIGKIIFSVFDAIAIYFLWHIIAKTPEISSVESAEADEKKLKQIEKQRQKQIQRKTRHADFVAQLYGYNPLFLYLTVRGSCEAIAMVLMYGFWYFMFGKNSSGNLVPDQIKQKKVQEFQPNPLAKVYAYIFYGLWVHFRVYPIVFLPLILLYEYRNCVNQSFSKLISTVIKMGIIAGGVFIFLFLAFYSLYGQQFVNETYLFHFTRKDNRHSFSPFFYDIYLHFFETKPLRMLPFLLMLFVITSKYSKKYSLFYLHFLLTFGFVEFNTVITLQYYQWIFGALLLVLPQSRILTFNLHRKGFNLAIQWFFGIAIWIWLSIKVQSDGENILFAMWVICLGKIGLDLWVLVGFMKTVKVQDKEELKKLNLQEAKQILMGKGNKN